MKKILLYSFLSIMSAPLYAQDCPQWPADCPETGAIQISQSRQALLRNGYLPQEIDMQDKMRNLLTDMMQTASEKLRWPMVEITEVTNLYANTRLPKSYELRPPQGIWMVFQFIANNDSLKAWKVYQNNYIKHSTTTTENYESNLQSVAQGPLYKQCRDSANYYMKLYTAYLQAHQGDKTSFFTTDEHTKYYQQKEQSFLNKAQALIAQTRNVSEMERDSKEDSIQNVVFKNHTVVQVVLFVNAGLGKPFERSYVSWTIKSNTVSYPVKGVKLSKLYTVESGGNGWPWHHSLLMLFGNFLNKSDKYGNYLAAYTQNGQSDLKTPKKIKSDQVQTILINIYGDKSNIERMSNIIDVEKLNSVIVRP